MIPNYPALGRLHNLDVTRLRERLFVKSVRNHLANSMSGFPCFENLTDVEVKILFLHDVLHSRLSLLPGSQVLLKDP